MLVYWALGGEFGEEFILSVEGNVSCLLGDFRDCFSMVVYFIVYRKFFYVFCFFSFGMIRG